MLHKKAVEILKENVFRQGNDCDYTAASGKLRQNDRAGKFLYPFQWLWDCFFISAWSADSEQSIKDVRKFLGAQRADGFIGHIRYNREVLAKNEYFPSPKIYYNSELPDTGEIVSFITQPPNIGYGAWELVKKIKNERLKREFAEEVLAKILRFHGFIYENLSLDGAMVVIHPWQAGDDNSPRWDGIYDEIIKGTKIETVQKAVNKWLELLQIGQERLDLKLVTASQRPLNSHYYIYLYLIYLYGQWGWDYKKIMQQSPFRVKDPMSTGILIRSNLALLEMARFLDDKPAEKSINEWLRISTEGLEKLWNEEDQFYYSVNVSSGQQIKIKTCSGLVPVFSQSIKKERAMGLARHIWDMARDEESFIIPSTFFTEMQLFEADRYWRGPVWIMINELVRDGLMFYQQTELATKITQESLELVYRSIESGDEGFYEYYNPFNGHGLGSPKQSWTAAAVLKILEEDVIG